MTDFIVYPAIDLRRGQVVRLKEGDPRRQTVFGADPAGAARRWLEAGAPWLHVVNLDGAFGQAGREGSAGSANRQAVEAILKVAEEYGARVQLGGGLRSLDQIERVLDLGVARAILGTMVIENPQRLEQVLDRFGAQRVAASLDARDGMLKVHGWSQVSTIRAVDAARELADRGMRWLIFTDIARDGLQTGLNLPATAEIARESGLQVIASGGLRGPEDIENARQLSLAGVIAGRALYEGRLDPGKLWKDR